VIRPAMMRALAFAATAPFASGAPAQAVPPEPPGEAFSLPFGPVPAEIHGVACKSQAGDADFAPSLRCFATDPLKQPSMNVSVADWRSRPTRAEMIAHTREAFHERSMFNVIREEGFVPPSDPDAVGFRGLYQTELGNRYVWTVLSKGKLIRVVATVFAPTDFDAMTQDIESKIFGVPASAATAEKDK
jgi:hypothetical protein